jgi:hypothetical protein
MRKSQEEKHSDDYWPNGLHAMLYKMAPIEVFSALAGTEV